MKIRIAIMLLSGWACISNAQPNSFVTETRQDLDIAIANFPEKVKPGNEISTVLGNQITPGSLPQDFRRNQQIYDDIAEVSRHIIAIKRMIFDLANQPTLIDNLNLAINQFRQYLTTLGIRYNISTATIQSELAEIRDQLPTNALNYQLNTNLMVPYNRMDIIDYEIENLLRTKIVGVQAP
jgi:hypothetical protein